MRLGDPGGRAGTDGIAIACRVLDRDPALLAEALLAMRGKAPAMPGRSAHEIENIGLVCRHLLLPKVQARRRRAEFLRWDEHEPTPAALNKAIARVVRMDDAPAEPTSPSLESELEITA